LPGVLRFTQWSMVDVSWELTKSLLVIPKQSI
jgi:hypothetical protein